MSVREQQVNDALRSLDEMHRQRRIARDEYRQRRRRLLDSLSEATELAGRDTVRRAVPDCDAPVARREAGGDDAGAGGVRKENEMPVRGMSPWRVAICVVGIGALACAAWCWFAVGT
ncbi:hypothetical protein [Burkholderia sp. 22PA0106]|uniref:hypothetical protein n=1 Tax=Burkholderia sp. 22PA0106 TaxID=3237371 RepID=UPI0039C1F83F